MMQKTQIQAKMNSFGKQGVPFGFIIDFEGIEGIFFDPSVQNEVKWEINHQYIPVHKNQRSIDWKIKPVDFHTYKTGFSRIMNHIHNGDTYLLNYTQPTRVESSLSPDDLFRYSKAPYKVYLKNRFICFSPECFIRIRDGKISSYPMKGTIDASVNKADQVVLNDSKELAEHNTIVDLIRNDLSMVASNVMVEKFRFLQKINTNTTGLWQVSSKITGVLPADYHKMIGDILFSMLPAGSVTGAPKPRTVEIIKETENYSRGFYTGIFGVFDGYNLDSCVLIRFIELNGKDYIYKSGGGITFMSNAEDEYNEMLKKVYVPV